MKNIKILWGVIVVLLIILIAVGYKVTKGNVEPSDDNRVSVILDKNERDLILGEMRDFLVSVQGISQAITEKNIDKIITLSTKAGMQAEAGTPGAIFRKIPIAMKILGFDTRKRFDEISDLAKQKQDMHLLRTKLDALMKNCIACHNTFKMPESINR
ncbi:InterPro IPR000345 [Bathymodiolus thermophilus thioautotrophic gill symbiont]|jgi:hypothetical protein|uniref:Cytochrome C n=1 Tax=Bathymodiolus thermophilus thioautotrophic gill symbiont TaxID=2360 RepID=A0A1J5U814_9GAMM|nr:hypothetical protein [Bathymodiolus thermophilus thioautotrophic gill symbiont]AYQ55909.1 hypothetical protein MS2017_0151 [Bathymodiolus thermophilus thioautotrophic gill symbiont]OIR24505.1 hypothetical protein BGC33_10775 [Bathymodiolus thermophilus thioautotrophic gill symbiont]CAB5493908.1 hypothetical protein THERMOT_10 [Bathymodiolus thermophilus thioautotrophic gill symbiont]CAB5498651.1 hypothetical protein THERMOS_881 [Bathymodiolus thermophilus thioautotrophic gill symbiont]SGZ80